MLALILWIKEQLKKPTPRQVAIEARLKAIEDDIEAMKKELDDPVVGLEVEVGEPTPQ